jgi:hypothetical protein
MWTITMQLYFNWNLKFENMKFEGETLKQVTHGSKAIDLPLH